MHAHSKASVPTVMSTDTMPQMPQCESANEKARSRLTGRPD
jgi:hypothetical protein